MALRPDQKALLFLVIVAALGAGVRIARAARRVVPSATQPALDHQLVAADSAAHAPKRRGAARGGRVAARRDPAADSIEHQRQRDDSAAFVLGRLDVDIATQQQLKMLPGVSDALAFRLVADRAQRGPFLSRDGLRRVRGVTPELLWRLDALITFSGRLTPLPEPPATLRKRRRGDR